jgi:hypothetical protein
MEMDKKSALDLIDSHKNKLINPVEMLQWSWLRVTVNQIPDDEWETYRGMAQGVMSK